MSSSSTSSTSSFLPTFSFKSGILSFSSFLFLISSPLPCSVSPSWSLQSLLMTLAFYLSYFLLTGLYFIFFHPFCSLVLKSACRPCPLLYISKTWLKISMSSLMILSMSKYILFYVISLSLEGTEHILVSTFVRLKSLTVLSDSL